MTTEEKEHEAFLRFHSLANNLTGQSVSKNEFLAALHTVITMDHLGHSREAYACRRLCDCYRAPGFEYGVTWEKLAQRALESNTGLLWAAFLRKAHEEEKDKEEGET